MYSLGAPSLTFFTERNLFRDTTLVEALKPEEISAKGISYRPFYKEKKKLLEDHLKALFVDNWKVFSGAGAKGLVLLYDEFHSIRDGAIRGDYPLASFLGAVSHAQREGCRYVLVLSGLPNLPTNLKEAKTYTERMFIFREMGNLSNEESEKAIRLPLRNSGYRFEDGLVERIIRETAGYPYFIQFYCHFLIENVRENVITSQHLDEIRKQLLRELDLSFFEDRFNKATPAEQGLLLAMASLPSDEMSPSQIMGNLGMDKSTFFTHLANLLEKNLIYKASRGRYAFSIPLFKGFLARKKAGWRR
jgi:DNA-binding transcriptional ArsR family regulator